MKKLILIFTVLLFVPVNVLKAQNIRVNSTVSEHETVLSLSYISIMFKGTTLGINSLDNGNNIISAVPNAILVFSFVDYKTVIAIKQTPEIGYKLTWVIRKREIDFKTLNKY